MPEKASRSVSAYTRRCIQREIKALAKSPVDGVRAQPNDNNILEIHYVIRGAADSPYEGGVYHGVLLLPSDYPMRPPAIKMMTPSGRFQVNKRLCLSVSDFHPDTWNPVWGIRTILIGLLSFMAESTITAGSIETSDSTKRRLAKNSLAYNAAKPKFRRMFPDLARQHDLAKKGNKQAAGAGAGAGAGASAGADVDDGSAPTTGRASSKKHKKKKKVRRRTAKPAVEDGGTAPGEDGAGAGTADGPTAAATGAAAAPVEVRQGEGKGGVPVLGVLLVLVGVAAVVAMVVAMAMGELE